MKPTQARLSQARVPMLDRTVVRSGDDETAFSLRGHAAVFNQPCDFGYFTEYVAPGAFEKALQAKPLEVLAVWDHDTRWILGNTLSDTVTLSEDAEGLAFGIKVAQTSFAEDLRVLIKRGDIQQCSFMFTIADETWHHEGEGDNENVTVTINEVSTLYDITVCGRGAYPQTDVSLASRMRLEYAIQEGRVPDLSMHQAHQRGFFPGAWLPDDQLAATRSAAQRSVDDKVVQAEREKAAFMADARTQVAAARAALPRT